jgi:uncharacterized SAM-binding protein YcdF (DUF218 family)
MNRNKYLFIGIVILFFTGIFFLKPGSFLTFEKQSSRSPGSIGFLLVGELRDRTLALAELYKSGKVDSIFYAKTKDTDFEYLDSLKVVPCRDSDNIKDVLIKLGIPSNKIVQFESQTYSTIDEANVLRDYLLLHPEIKKVTIVTSSYHSRRSFLIIKDRLNSIKHPIIIDVYQNHYSTINLKKWWKKKEDAVHVISEYMKIISFLFLEKFT